MQSRTLALGVFSLILAACSQLAPNTTPIYLAKLKGSNVVPAVSTEAWGFANATWNGTELAISGKYYRLSGKATSIELRLGEVGTNSQVLPICTMEPKEEANKAGNGSFSKSCTTTDGVNEDLLKTGKYYITVNTEANPQGELRGQLGLE